MPLELLPTLLLQILIVGYTPGPANIYAFAMALRHGRREALVMWLGLTTGFAIAVLAMATLTYFIGLAFGRYVVGLKYIGAVYLIFLAYQIFTRPRQEAAANRDCTFYSGMAVQLTNAKMLLFDLTVFSTFVLPYSARFTDLVTVGAWLLIGGPGANLVWLLAGSYFRKFFANYGRQVDIVSSLALVLCAIYIVFG